MLGFSPFFLLWFFAFLYDRVKRAEGEAAGFPRSCWEPD